MEIEVETPDEIIPRLSKLIDGDVDSDGYVTIHCPKPRMRWKSRVENLPKFIKSWKPPVEVRLKKALNRYHVRNRAVEDAHLHEAPPNAPLSATRHYQWSDGSLIGQRRVDLYHWWVDGGDQLLIKFPKCFDKFGRPIRELVETPECWSYLVTIPTIKQYEFFGTVKGRPSPKANNKTALDLLTNFIHENEISNAINVLMTRQGDVEYYFAKLGPYKIKAMVFKFNGKCFAIPLGTSKLQDASEADYVKGQTMEQLEYNEELGVVI